MASTSSESTVEIPVENEVFSLDQIIDALNEGFFDFDGECVSLLETIDQEVSFFCLNIVLKALVVVMTVATLLC